MATRALKRAANDLRVLQQAVAQHHDLVKAVEQTNEQLNSKAASDAFHWRITVQPPSTSVYAEHTYDLLFTLSSTDYPLQPPRVRVVSPIYSPLVDGEGKLCEGILGSSFWRPTTDPLTAVTHVAQALFVDYASHDALNEEAAQLVHRVTAGEPGQLQVLRQKIAKTRKRAR